MTDLKRPERLQIMLTPKELKALDDWRFHHRMPSRAAAVRELLKRGLDAAILEIAGDGRKSRDFSVMNEHQHSNGELESGARSETRVSGEEA